MRPIVFAFLLSLSFCNPTQTKKAANGNSKIFNAEQLIKDLQFLSSNELKGRLPGTPEMETARAYILNRFRQVGVDSFSTGIQQPFTFKIRSDGSATTGVNIFGVIKGRKRPKDYIVVTAHYDHLGVLSGNIYNGANDNASGTAALFAIASYFKKNPPDHSIIIVALDAEEQGLQGAKKFVADPPVSLTQVLLNVNSDMIGRDVNNNLYAVGTYHYPYLKTYLDKVKSEGSINLLYGYDSPASKEDWTSQSDHYQFHLKKIPFIYFGVEDFENHHKHTDDFQTMTLPFFVNAVELIIKSIDNFDRNLQQIKSATAANEPK